MSRSPSNLNSPLDFEIMSQLYFSYFSMKTYVMVSLYNIYLHRNTKKKKKKKKYHYFSVIKKALLISVISIAMNKYRRIVKEEYMVLIMGQSSPILFKKNMLWVFIRSAFA